MVGLDIRTYEVTFCSRVAGWLNALFALHPEWPFRIAEENPFGLTAGVGGFVVCADHRKEWFKQMVIWPHEKRSNRLRHFGTVILT